MGLSRYHLKNLQPNPSKKIEIIIITSLHCNWPRSVTGRIYLSPFTIYIYLYHFHLPFTHHPCTIYIDHLLIPCVPFTFTVCGISAQSVPDNKYFDVKYSERYAHRHGKKNKEMRRMALMHRMSVGSKNQTLDPSIHSPACCYVTNQIPPQIFKCKT